LQNSHPSATVSELIEALNWGATSIGAKDSWPDALRYAVDLCEASGFPMLIWWGVDAIQIYNDAYVPILGKRHPNALSQRGEACWPEAWNIVGPEIHKTRETGQPFSATDMPLSLERNGFVEETYFTFSYSRIGEGKIDCGVLCAVSETTQNVLREREVRMMADTIANVLFTHDAEGKIEWANSRWYEYSKLSVDVAILPEGWKRIVEATDYERFQYVVQNGLASREVYEVDICMKPDGQGDDAYRWFLLRGVPIRRPDGNVTRWAASVTDIHDVKIAAEQLRVQLERERELSAVFQRAALPQLLPAVPGLIFNAVYDPAIAEALVGGDWFDAFRLPDGRVVLSVGDVTGSGLSAAVTMGAVRHAIRGAAHILAEPSAILDAVDHVLRSEQPDRIVTSFVAVLDPLTLVLQFASAGHPSPMVRQPDGTVVELNAHDFPLGLRNEGRTEQRAGTFTLVKGSLFILFTNGLTKSNRDAVEEEHRLREVLASPEIYESEDPAAALRDALIATANDDIAILAVRIGETEDAIAYPRWRFASNDADTAMKARRQIGDMLRRFGATEGETYDAELVFGELIGNVVRHADGEIEAALDLSGDAPVLHVLDRGPGFTFYARLPKDDMSESGRGLYITTILAHDLTVIPRTDGGSHARAVLAFRLRRKHPLSLVDSLAS